ncbi:hypothetical protein T190130A13A_20083 [Tenacibaculum sp. 190130A14a]|uniref:Uncharacterized protein n=1 Tax=Tenacibaculum polynesiense TaxID=3137857 RepID=A0ABP1EV38_9FLAO
MVNKKRRKMKEQINIQCPNCWGYQEYDEQFSDRELCNCK